MQGRPKISTAGEWCARRDSNPHDVTHCHLKAARLPIPPRALGKPASACAPDRIDGAGCNKSTLGGQGLPNRCAETGTGSTATRQPRQHLLDFDPDAIAI